MMMMMMMMMVMMTMTRTLFGRLHDVHGDGGGEEEEPGASAHRVREGERKTPGVRAAGRFVLFCPREFSLSRPVCFVLLLVAAGCC
jgi:hypothetical protein